MSEPYDLQRFVAAQEDSFPAALRELQAGRKLTHWMWWIFPQFAGLGASSRSREYGISGAGEARAYLDHPLLRQRLEAVLDAMLLHPHASARRILGQPDDLKFHASMTLFDHVDPQGPWRNGLATFFDGTPHPGTLALLA